MGKKELASWKHLERKEIIFTRHYFEHGCALEAAKVAGYKAVTVQLLKQDLADPETVIGSFYQELCKDRIASTVIGTEKKRAALWDLAERSMKDNGNGLPKDSKLALQCLDMLNRMDGDYKPIQTDNRHLINQQTTATVNFQQNIPKPVAEAKPTLDFLKDKKRVING